ncbi:MAG: NHLP leader peptide family natural product precursor [Desulfobulbaceae bacterium]|nr:NHLP leader peptide family natural product precursor [Desulfobulbaceae bacterium]
MTDKLTSVVVGEMIAKAMQDDTFKQELLSDPDKVLAEGGVKTSGITYKATEDSDTKKHIALPHQPLTDAMKLETLPDGATPSEITRYIITKAQADESFKKQVLSDINTVLQDLGINLPAGISLSILEDTAATQNIVIPFTPPSSGELSDDQLAAVAGGKAGVVANLAAAINVGAVTEVAAAADVAVAAQVAGAVEAAAVSVAVVVLT